jgi:hypothetical protein
MLTKGFLGVLQTRICKKPENGGENCMEKLFNYTRNFSCVQKGCKPKDKTFRWRADKLPCFARTGKLSKCITIKKWWLRFLPFS